MRAMRGSPDRLDYGVFTRMAPLCPELIPEAIARLRSPKYSNHRTTLLGMIARSALASKEAIPELVKLLSEPDWVSTRYLFDTLAAFGPAAKDALPKLRELLDSPQYWVVLNARDAIARIEAKK